MCIVPFGPTGERKISAGHMEAAKVPKRKKKGEKEHEERGGRQQR